MSWVLVVPVVLGLATWIATPAVLRALPAPSDHPPGPSPYLALATRGFAAWAGVAVAAAGAVVVSLAPSHAPAWLGLGTAGVVSAMIDARVGYLPRRLSVVAWLLTALGVIATIWTAGDGAPLRSAVGALATLTLFWPLWRFGGGFGFGDIRLAPVVGAAAASPGWTMLAAGLLLASLMGVVWGIVSRASGRGKSFPYGPSLVAGPYLALAALAATGSLPA